MSTPVDKKNLAPIFIVGIPRSGTTLVKACLNKNSLIHILGETRFFLGPYSHRFFRIGSVNWKRDALKQAFSGIDPSLRADFGAVEEFFRDETKKGGSDEGPSDFFISFMQRVALSRNKVAFGEKTPLHFLAVPSILREFPGAKIIWVLRSYDSVKASVTERNNLQISTSRLDALFRLQHFFLKRYQHKVLTVQYVDVCNATRPTLESICEFVGVSFEYEMCVPGINNSSRNQDLFEKTGRYTSEDSNQRIVEVENEQRYSWSEVPYVSDLRAWWGVLRFLIRSLVAHSGANIWGAFRARRSRAVRIK